MKMIVGLGNIGPQYKQTRHNTGFMVVDAVAEDAGLTFDTRKMEAKLASGNVNGEKVLLVKPTTFMNESGRAVGPLMNFYKLEEADILVIQDDMDLPLGRLRFRDKGSAGGHNGIKSIIEALGTSQFDRLKVGIAHPQRQSVVKYVLGKFDDDQLATFNQVKDTAVNAVQDWLGGDSLTELMNRYN